ncbi:hypothetical protein MARCHEWKA_03590 [Brevundimonas phage vB_BpoS-Marchewka]|uniref:Uncharacterized protein n=1 Tax=Brevundimonas phage vB_BpoS-Marchewka TaxID=2948604 RepID=A0A9E7N2W0_9CAUD|nr:hypothetical protein MARCHEWKA_03590 [Brevundimonas phage vB_BpoS-Marchewka]UTC29317.1 hypothetical protein BAMBUS_02350 [Brevundimonas phage vB_BpoS-Bambus]
MSTGLKTLRLLAATVVALYVTFVMMGGAAYWINRLFGFGEGQAEHAVRGGALALLTLVGMFAAAVLARRVWKIGA